MKSLKKALAILLCAVMLAGVMITGVYAVRPQNAHFFRPGMKVLLPFC
ncbi:MAG: hypothetical protein K6F64_03600 [Clostridia bacterium]|nr:hypothetical protein [Clostridia bacterium]